MKPFTEECIDIIRSIPEGKVATYGQIARLAGNPRGARQVSRILSSMSRKYQLPWHRVINVKGKIVISDPDGRLTQKELLKSENIEVGEKFQIDLERYQWDI